MSPTLILIMKINVGFRRLLWPMVKGLVSVHLSHLLLWVRELLGVKTRRGAIHSTCGLKIKVAYNYIYIYIYKVIKIIILKDQIIDIIFKSRMINERCTTCKANEIGQG